MKSNRLLVVSCFLNLAMSLFWLVISIESLVLGVGDPSDLFSRQTMVVSGVVVFVLFLVWGFAAAAGFVLRKNIAKSGLCMVMGFLLFVAVAADTVYCFFAGIMSLMIMIEIAVMVVLAVVYFVAVVNMRRESDLRG